MRLRLSIARFPARRDRNRESVNARFEVVYGGSHGAAFSRRFGFRRVGIRSAKRPPHENLSSHTIHTPCVWRKHRNRLLRCRWGFEGRRFVRCRCEPVTRCLPSERLRGRYPSTLRARRRVRRGQASTRVWGLASSRDRNTQRCEGVRELLQDPRLSEGAGGGLCGVRHLAWRSGVCCDQRRAGACHALAVRGAFELVELHVAATGPYARQSPAVFEPANALPRGRPAC